MSLFLMDLRQLAAMAFVLGVGCRQASSQSTPSAPVDTRAPILAAARARLGADVPVEALRVYTVGDDEAAVVEDSRTNVCVILYQRDGWHVHALFRGGNPMDNEWVPPLRSAGTLQHVATVADLQRVLGEHCR